MRIPIGAQPFAPVLLFVELLPSLSFAVKLLAMRALKLVASAKAVVLVLVPVPAAEQRGGDDPAAAAAAAATGIVIIDVANRGAGGLGVVDPGRGSVRGMEDAYMLPRGDDKADVVAEELEEEEEEADTTVMG